MSKPRLLIEDWLPVQALSVECMRERGASSALPPTNFLHVWWARRPLTISRAAVLGSLLPADFDRATFERLLGFGCSGNELVSLRARMDTGEKVVGGFACGRAFSNTIRDTDTIVASDAMVAFWGKLPTVIDPMSGGGSIPLEAARLGLTTLASELNPVACSVLEATLDYPFRFGAKLAEKARAWGAVWEKRCTERLDPFYPREKLATVHAYILARTVPCPDTGHPTPLVADWSLSRPKGGLHIVAEPIVLDKDAGKWTIRVQQVGKGAGQLRQPPQPTYGDGKGVSLFKNTVISKDYIKAMAQQGKMGSVLYAVATKATTKLDFRPANDTDRRALEEAEKELERLRPQWEQDGVIPTEAIPIGDKTREPLRAGMRGFADMFSPRQLLVLGTLVEELHRLRPEIIAEEGEDVGRAVEHLLALGFDKFADRNSVMTRWVPSYERLTNTFDRHDFSFKSTFGEMAATSSGNGLQWAVANVAKALGEISSLPRAESALPVKVCQGSATNLLDVDDNSVTAMVIDPPYADNVQYSELADFFYVWLKRTQGYRRPEWFSTYLCDHDQEAVVNISRHRDNGMLKASQAREKAHNFYRNLMTDAFREAHRVLRDDGVLTVMFTHKKQEAWATLFDSLIDAGFTITATFPVQTESQHSLHQAGKNAAQSTVILVSRKREPGAGMHYYDDRMQQEIRQAAQKAAEGFKGEGLLPVDQLVGAFGPAMTVFSKYEEVRRDTGERVGTIDAMQATADAVAEWRVDQLAERGLDGVDAESRFYLLCWDVLRAAKFRFNEASLLGKAVGMDVSRLSDTGLIEKAAEWVKMLPATARRREKPVKTQMEQLALFEGMGRRKTAVSRKVHPGDEYFASAIDMCHALAIRFIDGQTEHNGIANAKTLAYQMGWGADSPCAKLMTALLEAAPVAVRYAGKGKKKTAADEFPEFRAWHAMLQPLFGIEPPEWKEPAKPLVLLSPDEDEEDDEAEEEGAEE